MALKAPELQTVCELVIVFTYCLVELFYKPHLYYGLKDIFNYKKRKRTTIILCVQLTLMI